MFRALVNRRVFATGSLSVDLNNSDKVVNVVRQWDYIPLAKQTSNSHQVTILKWFVLHAAKGFVQSITQIDAITT